MNNLIDVKFDEQHIWHPYTSMKTPLPSYPVQSANGVRIKLDNGQELIDGMSSWWSVIHGYNHPVINQAITDQLSKMSHVMFGGLTHDPAINLCKKLIQLTPEGLDKVFLADSGSVSVEVALKMAIQCQLGRGYQTRNKFVTIKHGYHGDTFGAMAVCDPENSMHSLYSDILPKNYFIEAPVSKPNDVFDSTELDELKTLLANENQHIAALILEPVVQGAGGMRFYHPQYIKEAKVICEQYNILLIADEIATGFGRTGTMFACEHAQITPDIMCLGKAITGGYMTLAATLCTQQVALDISQCEAGVLMHGPTFMANPLACAAANASLDLLMQGDWLQQVQNIEHGLHEGLHPCLILDGVEDVRVLGAIGVIQMKQPVNVAEIQKQFMQHNLWIRPFGKLIYVMPQYVISSDDLTLLTSGIVKTLQQLEL